MMNIKKAFVVLIVTLFIGTGLYPCTVAVVSGNGTRNGRPLLWKNRDSDSLKNKVMFFKGKKHDYLAIVNSESSEYKEVWAGMNSAGFCIMNSASYNLNLDEKKKASDSGAVYKFRKDEEGYFMKNALEECATVEDFEKLLDRTKGDRGIEANFGVIDAKGGAAFFETDNNGHTKYDANDVKIAPEGYILRTNYSFTGKRDAGFGYIRFDRASRLFHVQSATGGIDRTWLIQIASRDMVNELTGIDPMKDELPFNSSDAHYYYMSDSLTRNSACSQIFFEGVREGEAPLNTVMWTRLGHPLTSVVLPLWVVAGGELKLTTGKDNAPIDDFALYWYDRIFPLKGGSRDRYMNIAPLINRTGDGILNSLMQIEKEIIDRTEARLASGFKSNEEIKAFQTEIESYAASLLKRYFREASKRAGIE